MPGRRLKELVRYIHLNPMRAKLVADLKALDSYSYCGHSALMGKKRYKWQDIKYVLGFYGTRIGEARKKYRAYAGGRSCRKCLTRIIKLFYARSTRCSL
jgi:hypothetical protein